MNFIIIIKNHIEILIIRQQLYLFVLLYLQVQKTQLIMSSYQWQQRLDNAKEKAEDGEEGDVTFMQVSSRPVTSLFITTGEKRHPSLSTKREVHLRFVSQHEGYPYCIQSNDENDTLGYSSLKEAVKLCDEVDIKKIFLY